MATSVDNPSTAGFAIKNATLCTITMYSVGAMAILKHLNKPIQTYLFDDELPASILSEDGVYLFNPKKSYSKPLWYFRLDATLGFEMWWIAPGTEISRRRTQD